jgi:RimJ/RimL family protein N-acetyltransferase
MPATAPIVETPRLILRPHHQDDLNDYASLWADPVVVRYTTGIPQTHEESWRRLLFASGHWAVMGFGYWVIEEKNTKRFVGEVGFADLRREITPSLAGMPECGWIVSPWLHGKGYATEAVRAVHEWSHMELGAKRTCCIVSPENDASIRVAEKTGYREVAQTLYKDHPVIVFHRDP